jgi:hypothetical protein
MKLNKKEWELKTISELKIEAERVISRIDEWEFTQGFEYPTSNLSEIKRASLDFNRVGIKIRKGYWKL